MAAASSSQQSEQIRSILRDGNAEQLRLLIWVEIPGVPTRKLRESFIRGFKEDSGVLEDIGYSETRFEVPWIRRCRGNCEFCHARSRLSPCEQFACGHVVCSSCAGRFCPKCGPSFLRNLNPSDYSQPQPPRVYWPSVPTTLTQQESIECRQAFADSVVQAHKNALGLIPLDTMVSFALNRSTEGIGPFLESHQHLARIVEETADDEEALDAWRESFEASTNFKLLSYTIRVGLGRGARKWNVFIPEQNPLWTHLAPIRDACQDRPLPEQLKLLPQLTAEVLGRGELRESCSKDTSGWQDWKEKR